MLRVVAPEGTLLTPAGQHPTESDEGEALHSSRPGSDPASQSELPRGGGRLHLQRVADPEGTWVGPTERGRQPHLTTANCGTLSFDAGSSGAMSQPSGQR
jgi:hypothetical protein